MRLLWLALLLAGCVHLQGGTGSRLSALPPLSQEQCTTLDHRVLGLNVTTVIVGAGASGASTLSGVLDEPAARYSLVAGAAVFGLTGALTGYLAGYYSARFTQRCPQ